MKFIIIILIFVPIVISGVAVVHAILTEHRQIQRGGNGSVQIQAGRNIEGVPTQFIKKLEPPKSAEALKDEDLDWLGPQVDLYRKDKDGISE